MNLTELEKKLLAAARADTPDDRVPYAFEKRIMARLKAAPPLDALTLWSRALWRAAVSCAAVALLSGAWTFWSGQGRADTADFSQEFESVVFASADSVDEVW